MEYYQMSGILFILFASNISLKQFEKLAKLMKLIKNGCKIGQAVELVDEISHLVD